MNRSQYAMKVFHIKKKKNKIKQKHDIKYFKTTFYTQLIAITEKKLYILMSEK